MAPCTYWAYYYHIHRGRKVTVILIHGFCDTCVFLSSHIILLLRLPCWRRIVFNYQYQVARLRLRDNLLAICSPYKTSETTGSWFFRSLELAGADVLLLLSQKPTDMNKIAILRLCKLIISVWKMYRFIIGSVIRPPILKPFSIWNS